MPQDELFRVKSQVPFLSMARVSGPPPPDQMIETTPCWIEYRLARDVVVRDFEQGRIRQPDICDAHPELLRVANNIGQQTDDDCPICKTNKLVWVYFAFGAQLPRGGKPIIPGNELKSMVRARPDANFYVVEVCTGCNWNFLMKMFEGAALKRGQKLSRSGPNAVR